MNDMPMTNEQRQYHLEEYKCLKNEIAESFKESFQVVVFSVTANAAIIAFVSSHSDLAGHGAFRFLYAIPLFVAFVSYALYLLRRRSISRIAQYLYRLENAFAAKDLGWERFYAGDIDRRPWFVRTPTVLSAVLLIQIIYAAIFLLLK